MANRWDFNYITFTINGCVIEVRNTRIIPVEYDTVVATIDSRGKLKLTMLGLDSLASHEIKYIKKYLNLLKS